MKVERVSYDVITPSAARGVVEAIYWKPQITWVIDRLHVLNPIRFTSLRRNEVGAKIPEGTARKVMKDGRGELGLYVEEERQQRAALMLQDVAYVIEAHCDLREAGDHPAKHIDQFARRARAGQCFTRPYLGTRECAADFALIEDDAPIPSPHESLRGTRDLGWMLHDIDFKNDRQPRFFHATMTDGVITVPPFNGKEVRQ
jgi:CRISPR-associated protein Cas5d